MIYVLDTNAVSALMKGSAAVVERLAAIRAVRYRYSPTRSGGDRIRDRAPAALQASNRVGSTLDLICSELPRAEWTDAVSHAYGRIKATLEQRGTRIEDFDAAIAAHALATGATLVTANLDHMTRVPGLQIEDWAR